MAGVSGRYRHMRGMSEQPTEFAEQRGPESGRVPGSTGISIPLGGRDNRSAARHGDAMEAHVGGKTTSSFREHLYTEKDPRKYKANRPRLSRNYTVGDRIK